MTKLYFKVKGNSKRFINEQELEIILDIVCFNKAERIDTLKRLDTGDTLRTLVAGNITRES